MAEKLSGLVGFLRKKKQKEKVQQDPNKRFEENIKNAPKSDQRRARALKAAFDKKQEREKKNKKWFKDQNKR